MGKPLRVLIVEDSEDDAILVIHELKRGGYDVTFKRVEPAEALTAALDQQAWDIILSDYRLPHFSAPESLALLHQSSLDLPFIVISGTIGEETAVEMMKAGAHDYLMKGNLTRLVPAVERELHDAEVRKERKRADYDLKERMKELRCLYNIAAISERKDFTLDELYQEVINILPQGWQYPEITCARITVDGKSYKTKNYRETPWKQSSDIKVHGEKVGVVQVEYLEEKPELDEGPFTKEERELIDAVAERLARIIERKQMEEALRESEVKHRTLIENLPQKIFHKTRNSAYVSCNENYARDLKLLHNEIVG